MAPTLCPAWVSPFFLLWTLFPEPGWGRRGGGAPAFPGRSPVPWQPVPISGAEPDLEAAGVHSQQVRLGHEGARKHMKLGRGGVLRGVWSVLGMGTPVPVGTIHSPVGSLECRKGDSHPFLIPLWT